MKPGNPVPYSTDDVEGKLHVTQATLGVGPSTEKSILQCASGRKNPVFLCSLLPNKVETCPLNLKFGEDDLVAFSVVGSRSIHLSGYFVPDDDDTRDDYEYDSLGEDVGTGSEESSEFDSENGYDDHFFDDSDMEMYTSSPVRSSGVVIEEIPDEQTAHLKEKPGKSSQLPVVIRGDNKFVLESEDEDGFPISTSDKAKSESQKAETETKGEQAQKKTGKSKKKAKDVDESASLKRKVQAVDEDEQLQDGKKKKKKNKLKDHGKEESAHVKETNVTVPDEKSEEVKTTTNQNNVSHAKDGDDGKLSNDEVLVEKKNKKKKKKKTKEAEGEAAKNEIATTVENQKLSTSEKKKEKEPTEAKPSNVRTYPNGLVIEDISMGKPDGKRADLGKKVSVRYTGKLQKDGKIFDSCIGKAPFKFRLGVGQVIKGWDVGVNGMRVGDKRRLTIPPSMGYGDKRVGSIPQNSWLIFDVELVGVEGR